MNALQYKHSAPCGDPGKNGMGSWRAGEVKLIREGQERYAASLAATGGFDLVTVDGDAPYVHTADEAEPQDTMTAWDNDPDATEANDNTTDDEE